MEYEIEYLETSHNIVFMGYVVNMSLSDLSVILLNVLVFTVVLGYLVGKYVKENIEIARGRRALRELGESERDRDRERRKTDF
jgi:uncharacterized membrane-anchored protein